MFSSDTGAMVDAAAVPQIGCRTRCQHPGCGRPIEFIPPAGPPDPVDHPVWAHLVIGTWVGPDHEATPVEPEQLEPAAQRMFANFTYTYDGYRLGREDGVRAGRREGLLDLAAQLREQAKDGVDEFPAALRYAAREAERCAGGER